MTTILSHLGAVDGGSVISRVQPLQKHAGFADSLARYVPALLAALLYLPRAALAPDSHLVAGDDAVEQANGLDTLNFLYKLPCVPSVRLGTVRALCGKVVQALRRKKKKKKSPLAHPTNPNPLPNLSMGRERTHNSWLLPPESLISSNSPCDEHTSRSPSRTRT